MKKIFAVILAFSLCLGLFSGCSGNSKSSTPVSNSSSSIGDAEEGANIAMMGGAQLIAVTKVVLGDFITKHPEIKINFQSYSAAEYPIKMKLQLSTHSSTPDVMLIHDWAVSQFVKAGYLMDLTGTFNKKDILTTVLGPVTNHGRYYGLPNQVSNQYVFMYRKDIYDQLGMTPPATFDEYFQQGLKLKSNGYFAGAFDPSAGSLVFTNFLYMLGGEIFDSKGNVTLNKGVEALDLVQKCYNAGIWHKSNQGSDENYWTAFNEGKIAAFPGPAYEAAYYETKVDPKGKGGYGHLQVAPAMEFAPNGPKTYINNTEFFTINKNTKYPNASKIVLSYLTQSVEASLKFSNVNQQGLMARYCNGYIPGMKELEKGSEEWPAFGGQQVVTEYAKTLLTIKPSYPYVDERTNETGTIITNIIGDMLIKHKYTSSTAIQAMKSKIKAI